MMPYLIRYIAIFFIRVLLRLKIIPNKWEKKLADSKVIYYIKCFYFCIELFMNY